MKTFSQYIQQTPVFQIVCDAKTLQDKDVRFEFKVEAINEKLASSQADELINSLNLKSVVKKLTKI